ncbi:MAG: hypothetical protein QM479_11670 [Pseudomonadota bacterium]
MKYSGLLLLLIIGLSISYSWQQAARSIKVPRADNNAQISNLLEIIKVDENKLLLINQASEKIKELSQKKYPTQQLDNLIAMPYATPLESATENHRAIDKETHSNIEKPVKSKTTVTAVYNYAVSMVFISQTSRYAVVNKKFVREGDNLLGGAKVVSISAGELTIKQYGKYRKLIVAGSSSKSKS